MPGPFQPEILKWFTYGHLPEGNMRDWSARICLLAEDIAGNIPDSAERATALRKLLECKDATVRAARSIGEGK